MKEKSTNAIKKRQSFKYEEVLLVPDEDKPETWTPVYLNDVLHTYKYQGALEDVGFIKASEEIEAKSDPVQRTMLMEELPKLVVTGIRPNDKGKPNDLMAFEVECDHNHSYTRMLLEELGFIALLYFNPYRRRFSAIARVTIDSIDDYSTNFTILSEVVNDMVAGKVVSTGNSPYNMITLINDPCNYNNYGAVPLQAWIEYW